MKKVMEENRVPTAHHFITEEVVKSLPDGMSFPVIVKPVDCNSSKGVVKVNSNLELQEAVNTAIRYSRTDNAIVEDFVSGRELTIDAFVQGGKSQVLCISELDKIKSNNSFIIFRSMNPARVTEKHIAEILKSNKIVCSGVVSGEAHIKKASCKIDEVISDVIMVTTPSSAHKDIARVLAPFVTKDTVIVLNPGRTFGAIEFAETLKNCGVVELPHIAETQTIVYTCRRSDKNSVTIFALKEGVKIASIAKDDLNYILAAIPECIRWYFIKSNSVVETSMTNVGMVLHCAPVLMNIGWIESEKTEFKYYYDGISKSVATFLEKIDSERIAVAKALGEDIESVKHWLERTYSTSGNNLFETIQNNASYREIDAPPTINCRYIFEDVPNGLVPVEKMGRELGVTTPNISLVIDLANAVMETDFRKTGRSYCYELVKKYL